jgi:hypothetical protein
MAVSEAFIKAGVCKARNHALRLILTHVPTLLTSEDPDKRLAAKRGLQYAYMLGGQHGFAHEVEAGIERAKALLEPPADPELEAAKAMFQTQPEPMREAAE